jgi:hypothetical protein
MGCHPALCTCDLGSKLNLDGPVVLVIGVEFGLSSGVAFWVDIRLSSRVVIRVLHPHFFAIFIRKLYDFLHSMSGQWGLFSNRT